MLKPEEKKLEFVKQKLSECRTLYNQLAYLEGIAREDLDIVVKKFIYIKLVELYISKGMFDKAAKAMKGKAALNTLYRELVEDYGKAGELYIKAGRIDEGKEMFSRALTEANAQQANELRMTMKNILFTQAKELETKHRTSAAVKYYEETLRIPNLNEVEKEEVKNKLRGTYKSLGMFRELKMLDGNNSERAQRI